MFVSLKTVIIFLMIVFLSSFCQLLPPQFQARTDFVHPDHGSLDHPAMMSSLSNVVSLIIMFACFSLHEVPAWSATRDAGIVSRSLVGAASAGRTTASAPRLTSSTTAQTTSTLSSKYSHSSIPDMYEFYELMRRITSLTIQLPAQQ